MMTNTEMTQMNDLLQNLLLIAAVVIALAPLAYVAYEVVGSAIYRAQTAITKSLR